MGKFPFPVPSQLLMFQHDFRYRGTAHAFSSIVKHSGVAGLWKGWLPNVQRAALVNLGGQDLIFHAIQVKTFVTENSHFTCKKFQEGISRHTLTFTL
jgi:hypothetical protein